MLVAVAAFTAYTLSGGTLTAQKAFVSLSLFNILRFPLSAVPMVINNIVEATVTLKRLHAFLVADEVDPGARLTLPAVPVDMGNSESESESESSGGEEIARNKQKKDMMTAGTGDRISSGKQHLLGAGVAAAVEVRGASFKWDSAVESVLGGAAETSGGGSSSSDEGEKNDESKSLGGGAAAPRTGTAEIGGSGRDKNGGELGQGGGGSY